MTFNKSDLGMCKPMVTDGHFITIKIFPGAARGKSKVTGASLFFSCHPPPLAPPMIQLQ